jgi:hypothetical protein
MPFVRNEQTASADILPLLHKGDLLIRDLGYWVLDTLNAIAQQGAFFISRYRHDCTLWMAHADQRLELARHLRKHGHLDTIVRVGLKHAVPMRLLAIPLPHDVAQKRRRELKHNRDRRLNPSKERLFLCGWALFVTNVDRETWTPEQVANVYSLRWRIETVFKSWKSAMKLNNLPKRCSPYYFECTILIRLLLILFTHVHIWMPLVRKMMNGDKPIKPLSILKTFSFVQTIITTAYHIGHIDPQILDEAINRHCQYETRTRMSYIQKLYSYSWLLLS